MTSFKDLDRNMPILVVDDYPSMRRIVKNCLRQLGFENVAEAENAAGALQHLAEHECQFIISDWTVPDMKGEELLQAFRLDEKLKQIPVLVVAPDNHKPILTEEDILNHSQVIIKPFTKDILKSKMVELFPV